MTLSFMKIHSSGSDCIVVNMADTSATDVAEMARRLCPPPLGVGADSLVVINHLERSRFAVRCLHPDGSGLPPDDRMLRCCARAIAIRYGYQSAILLNDGFAYRANVVGQDIGLRFWAPCDTPLRGVYREDWKGAGSGVMIQAPFQVNDASTGEAVPNAVTLAPMVSVCDDDPIGLDRRHEPLPIDQASSALAEATWLYGTAILLFEGEFPWP